jgi:hypothetical protein
VVVASLICAAGGLALGEASWYDQPYTLDVLDHITGIGQEPNGSLVMRLDHVTPCTIVVSVATELISAGNTLATSYKLTGTDLENGGDGGWVDSSTFLNRNYEVLGAGPSSDVTIWVRATASSDKANDAGTYSASVILTASW